MKAAVIGASREAAHTIKKAREHGIRVLALDGNPRAEGLKTADYSMVVDISDENAVIETLKKEKPDFVLPVPIGRYLTTTGAVNDALGLPGISREMAVLCTDKYLFHQKLSGDGLRECHCTAVNYGVEKAGTADGTDAKIDMREFLFPAILKPRYGSGSRGIYMADNREQLRKFLPLTAGEAYVLEECIAGEEYGVDGAVTEDGFQMILLRKKINTPPPARQAVGYFSVLPADEFRLQVQQYMADIISSLGLKECLLHADIIKGAKGPFVIELSARPSGHNLHNLFTPLCTGVDMAEEYIKYQMRIGGNFVPRYTRSMLIHYFDMQGKVRCVPDRGQAERAVGASLAAWECTLREEDELRPVSDGHSLMERGYFVLEGEDQVMLEAQATAIRTLFMT